MPGNDLPQFLSEDGPIYEKKYDHQNFNYLSIGLLLFCTYHAIWHRTFFLLWITVAILIVFVTFLPQSSSRSRLLTATQPESDAARSFSAFLQIFLQIKHKIRICSILLAIHISIMGFVMGRVYWELFALWTMALFLHTKIDPVESLIAAFLHAGFASLLARSPGDVLLNDPPLWFPLVVSLFIWECWTQATDEWHQQKFHVSKFTDIRALFDSAKIPIFSINMNGILTYWNREMELVTGYTQEQVVGEGIAKVVAAHDLSQWRVLSEALEKGESPPSIQVNIRHVSGKIIQLLLTTRAKTTATGRASGLLCMGLDVTDSCNQMEESNKAAAETAAKSTWEDLLSYLQLEMRNPLQRALHSLDMAAAYVSMGASSLDPEPYATARASEMASDQIEVAMKNSLLLRTILDTVIDCRRDDVNIRPDTVCTEAIDTVRTLCALRGHNPIVFIPTPRSSDLIVVPEKRVTHMVVRMLTNVLSHAVPETEITLRVLISDTDIRFEANSLCRPGLSDHSKPFGISGLGLYFARLVSDRLDGACGVETDRTDKRKPIKKFYFRLPFSESDIDDVGLAARVRSRTTSPVSPEGHTQPKTQILVAVSDETVASELKDMLSTESHSLEVATSGRAAVENHSTGKFQIVLVDDSLRDGSPLDTIRRCRASDSATAIIALVQNPNINLQLTHYTAGADYVVAKPFSRAAFRAVMAVMQDTTFLGRADTNTLAHNRYSPYVERAVATMLNEESNSRRVSMANPYDASVWALAAAQAQLRIQHSSQLLREELAADEQFRAEVAANRMGIREVSSDSRSPISASPPPIADMPCTSAFAPVAKRDGSRPSSTSSLNSPSGTATLNWSTVPSIALNAPSAITVYPEDITISRIGPIQRQSSNEFLIDTVVAPPDPTSSLNKVIAMGRRGTTPPEQRLVSALADAREQQRKKIEESPPQPEAPAPAAAAEESGWKGKPCMLKLDLEEPSTSNPFGAPLELLSANKRKSEAVDPAKVKDAKSSSDSHDHILDGGESLSSSSESCQRQLPLETPSETNPFGAPLELLHRTEVMVIPIAIAHSQEDTDGGSGSDFSWSDDGEGEDDEDENQSQ